MRKLTVAFISLIAISLMAIVLTGASAVTNGPDQDTPPPPESPSAANIIAQYDLNANGTIEHNEVIAAVQDYFEGLISREDVLAIINYYISGDTIPVTAPPPAQLSDMIERVRPAVVKIQSSSGWDRGTGVIFKVENNFAYIVTNQHVVGRDTTFQLDVYSTAHDHHYNPWGANGQVLAVDHERDLAVIRTACPPPRQCFAAEFGDSLALSVGDPVVAIGYPRADVQPLANVRPIKIDGELDPPSVTQGIVSAFRYHSTRKRQLVQHDAPINTGSSGSPLFNSDGMIVGINTFEIRGSEGLNYAIAETTVQNQLPDLLAGRDSGTPSTETALATIYGPMAGHLHHEPDDGAMEVSPAPLSSANVYIGAWFVNPYAHGGILGGSGGFSHGFLLRGDSTGHLRVYVGSDGTWRIIHYSAASRNFTRLASGTTPHLEPRKGQYNHLLVGAISDFAVVFLNGHPLTASDGSKVFPLGGHTTAGWTWIGTGFRPSDEYAGQITSFTGFRIAIPVSADLSNDRTTIPPAVEEWASKQYQAGPPPGPEQHSHGPSNLPQEQAKPSGQ